MASHVATTDAIAASRGSAHHQFDEPGIGAPQSHGAVAVAWRASIG
jgi:hypothetical protein